MRSGARFIQMIAEGDTGERGRVSHPPMNTDNNAARTLIFRLHNEKGINEKRKHDVVRKITLNTSRLQPCSALTHECF